jgi:ABC-type uncharacterized transport system substrate-binding protein
MMLVELTPKRPELLSELVPAAKVMALLVNPKNANAERVMRNTQDAARAKGVQLHVVKAGTEGEIEKRVRDPRPATGRSARRRQRCVLS